MKEKITHDKLSITMKKSIVKKLREIAEQNEDNLSRTVEYFILKGLQVENK